MSVQAPYWADPAPPGGQPGQAYFGLWEYEVVEAFFLNAKDQYLEVEFGPHGQHIVLLLNGRRNAVKYVFILLTVSVSSHDIGKLQTHPASGVHRHY